jgi:hypothetical protein
MSILWLAAIWKIITYHTINRYPDWLRISSWVFLLEICAICFSVTIKKIEWNQALASAKKKSTWTYKNDRRDTFKRWAIACLLSLLLLGFGSFGLIRFQSFMKERVALGSTFEFVINEIDQLNFESLPVNPNDSLMTPFLILERLNKSGWQYGISRQYEFTQFPIPDLPTELKGVVVILRNERFVRAYTPSGDDAQWIFDCCKLIGKLGQLSGMLNLRAVYQEIDQVVLQAQEPFMGANHGKRLPNGCQPLSAIEMALVLNPSASTSLVRFGAKNGQIDHLTPA